MIADPSKKTRQPARAFSYDAAAHVARIGLPVQATPLIVDWNIAEGSTYATREDVSGTVLPSVAEIMSRYQAAQAAQDALVISYVANATMEQHFRTTSTDPGFDVVTENRFYAEGKKTEWEESLPVNGTRWDEAAGFSAPPAEKVLSPPSTFV